MVLCHSRWIWGQSFVPKALQTVARCHIVAFTDMDGAPQELPYDQMKTAVISEDGEGVVT